MDAWNIEEDEIDSFEKQARYGRNCALFAIDCSSPMFLVKTEDGDNHFEAAVKTARIVYNLKCVTSDKDYLGVLFFNTDKSNNSHSFDHIYVLHELGLPGAERVKELDDLVKGDVKKRFSEKFGSADCKLDEMFWMASTMFSNAGAAEGVKQLYIFTNCDNPHRNDPNRQDMVKQKITDLRELKVEIDVFAIGRGDFNYEDFYGPLIYDGNSQVYSVRPASRLDELRLRTVRKNYRKRAVSNISFQLGRDVELSVDVFNMFAITRPPVAVKLDRKTNREIKSAQTFLDAESGEKLLPVDLKKYQVYGGTKVAMEVDEVDQTKRLCDTGLVLLGFKNKGCLKPTYFVRSGFFLFPNELLVNGGSLLFRTLLERCVEKDVVPICRLTLRRNMPPRLVALMPQVEAKDAKGEVETSAGFNLVFLPYAEDIRDLGKIEAEPRPRANEDQIDKAAEIISQLCTTYDVEKIENPALQRQYKAIEAFALDAENVGESNDFTLPKTDWMARKAGTLFAEFKNLVYADDYVVGGNKKRGGATAGGAAKKAKAASNDVSLEEFAKSDRLESLTVATLRELCTSNNIKLTILRKAEIIGQIKQHYGV